MKLSVIVPVYKVECYLRECIESILRQDFTDFELILVDDGSPDRCGEICDEYAINDHRVWVIHKSNGGLSSARNAGLDMATGDYVAFVDSDDFIASDFFSRAMQVLADRPETDLVEMPVMVHYNHPHRFIYTPDTPTELCREKGIFSQWIAQGCYMHAYAWNKIYRRTLFDNIRYPEGEFFEDVCTTPRLLEKCRKVFRVAYTDNSKLPITPDSQSPTGLYYYRYRESSITTAATVKALCDALGHHLVLFAKATADERVTRQEKAVYLIRLTNMFIELLRCEEATEPPYSETVRQAAGTLQANPLTIVTLTTLPLPLRDKLKNLPLALFGHRLHCFIYSHTWLPAR